MSLFDSLFDEDHVPTRAEIAEGGFTRMKLARWGVSWPPRAGWRKALEAQADSVYGVIGSPNDRSSEPPWMSPEESARQKGKPPW